MFVKSKASQKYSLVSLCLTELSFGISVVLDNIGQLFGFPDKSQK